MRAARQLLRRGGALSSTAGRQHGHRHRLPSLLQPHPPPHRCCLHSRGAASTAAPAAGISYGPDSDDDDEHEAQDEDGLLFGGDDDEYDDDDWAPPLGALLLTHAVRGVYRTPPPGPPPHIARRLRQLARMRGVPELEQEWKGIYKSHIEAHGDPAHGQRYRTSKAAHRSGNLGWSARASSGGERSLETALESSGDSGGLAVPYSTAAAEAYSFRRFVPSHSHHMRIMQEIVEVLSPDDDESLGGFRPQRVIDFGCGPGAGLTAAAQTWPESVVECVGVDSSLGMLAAAEVLLAPDEVGAAEGDDEEEDSDSDSDDAPTAITSKQVVRLESTLGAAMLQTNYSKRGGGGNRNASGFDLAIISGTLSELGSDSARAAALDALWSSLNEGGVLIVQEHGGAVGALTVAGARDQLLSDAVGLDGEIQMITPSPHTEVACPVAAEGLGKKNPAWVNFAQRVHNSTAKGHGAKGRKDVIAESTSYFAARKVTAAAKIAETAASAEERTVSELLLHLYNLGRAPEEEGGGKQSAHAAAAGLVRSIGEDEGWWADRGEEGVWCTAASSPYEAMDWARIIESPARGKKQVTLKLLTPVGTVETLVVSKRAWAGVPGGYTMARRAEWGGLWPWPTPMTPSEETE